SLQCAKSTPHPALPGRTRRPSVCRHDPQRGDHGPQRAAPSSPWAPPSGADGGYHADDSPGHHGFYHWGAVTPSGPPQDYYEAQHPHEFLRASMRRRPDAASTCVASSPSVADTHGAVQTNGGYGSDRLLSGH